MLTFKKSKTTENVAIIKDEDNEGLNNNKILFIDSSRIDAPINKKLLTLEDNEQFMIYPTVKPERVYIVGPNGSGKSWQAGKYCESYNMAYPKNKIIMFSPHERDDAYRNVKNLIIMDLMDLSLYEEPMDITRLKNCLIIFDDCDNHQNPKAKKWLDAMEKDLIMNGRKYGIYVLSIAHMMMNGQNTRHKIAESNRTIFFTHAGSSYHITRYLTIYQGLSKEQIQTIMTLKSRWVCISSSYPQYVLYDTGCYLLK